MTKRHCGTIAVRYSALSAEGANSLPPVPRPSPWPAAPRSLPTSSCPTTSSAATCPATVRGLCLRRATSRPSGVARPHIRRRTPSPPLSPRSHVEDVVHGGEAASSQRRVSRDRQRSFVSGARSRLSSSCHRGVVRGDIPWGGLVCRRPPPTSPRPSASFATTCPATVRAAFAREGRRCVRRESRGLAPGGARLLPLPSLLPRSRGIVCRDVLHGFFAALLRRRRSSRPCTWPRPRLAVSPPFLFCSTRLGVRDRGRLAAPLPRRRGCPGPRLRRSMRRGSRPSPANASAATVPAPPPTRGVEPRSRPPPAARHRLRGPLRGLSSSSPPLAAAAGAACIPGLSMAASRRAPAPLAGVSRLPPLAATLVVLPRALRDIRPASPSPATATLSSRRGRPGGATPSRPDTNGCGTPVGMPPRLPWSRRAAAAAIDQGGERPPLRRRARLPGRWGSGGPAGGFVRPAKVDAWQAAVAHGAAQVIDPM